MGAGAGGLDEKKKPGGLRAKPLIIGTLAFLMVAALVTQARCCFGSENVVF